MTAKVYWIMIAILVPCCGTLPAQTIEADPGKPGITQAAEAQNPSGPNMPMLLGRYPRYQVMPSDVLDISFPLIPELQTTSVTVQPDGFINLPHGSETMYVKGRTIPQITESLTKTYAKTMHNPIVNVDIKNFQPLQFTVNGQVGRPGQYPLRTDTTVSEGVAVAGGFLSSAKTQVFLFHRVSSDWVEVKRVNLKQLLNGHNIHEDVHIQAGDMIFVPDKFITKFRHYVPYSLGLGSAVGFSGTALLNQ
jgi:polysaccharide export outer membrane protein